MAGTGKGAQSGGKAPSSREGKYLTFFLEGEEYGIGILKVKEIIGMMPITMVPRTPAYIRGVVNLRGKVIPVVDLRRKFAMEDKDYTERTCIIVVEISGAGAAVLTGVVVDSVTEVVGIKESEIEEAPVLGAALATSHILGMAKIGKGVKILLNIDRVLGAEELEDLGQAS